MAITTYTIPAEKIVHNTSVDFSSRFSIINPIHIVQYDNSLPIISVELKNDNKTYVLPSNIEVWIRWKKQDNTFVRKQALGCNSERNTVYFEITQQMVMQHGSFKPVVELIIPSDSSDPSVASSGYFSVLVDRNPIQNGDIESMTEYEDPYGNVYYTKTVIDNMIVKKADKATTLAEYGIKDAYTKTDTNTLLKEKTISTINNLVVQIMEGKKPFITSSGLVMFADDDRYNYVKVNVTPGKCYAVNNSNAADAFSFFVDSKGYKIGSVADCKDTSNGYHITAPEEATILLLCGLTDSFPAAEIVAIETDRRVYGAVSVNDFPICEINNLYSHTISRHYKTMAEALSDNLLNIGDTFTTLGYYAVGDGGASKYYVSSNMQTIGIKFNRIEAYAIPIYDDFLSAGAIGFLPSNPDANLLNKALSVACCRLVKGTYTLSTNIVIPSRTVLDLNKSIINGRIVFAGALWSTLRNGYIHGGDSNAIAFSTARNGNTTVEDLEITSNTVAVIFDGADTGYNIFRNVKINAPIGIRLASGNEYAPNYIFIDKCAITGKRDTGTGIGIDVYCPSNYLWVTNCDLLGDTAIRIRKSSENFTISGNAFFSNKIGLQIDENTRIFNMRLTDNLFSDQNNVGAIPIKCDGAISYSKIDNEFYNITNGYTVNDSTCSSFGVTVDAINGQLSNTIRGANIQRTNAQVFTQTYDEAGKYTFKVYAFGLPYKATPIVQVNGGTVNSVTVNGIIIEVSVTMDSPGNVNIIAI